MNDYLMYINHIKLNNVKELYFDSQLVPRIIPKDKNKTDLYDDHAKFEDCILFFESLRPEEYGEYKAIVNYYKLSYKNMSFEQLCKEYSGIKDERYYNKRLENIYLEGVEYIGNGGEFYVPGYELASFYKERPDIAKIYLKEALNVARLSNSGEGVEKCRKLLKKINKKQDG
ncbi:hypothetical protein EQH57_0420 [Dictyocoela roeselum]|nr:hypothetical protein EQH57_0420 [Dictyocoela roeselum]